MGNKYVDEDNIEKLRKFVNETKKENKKKGLSTKVEIKSLKAISIIMEIAIDTSKKEECKTFLIELEQYVKIMKIPNSKSYRIISIKPKPTTKVVARSEIGRWCDELILNMCTLSTMENSDVNEIEGNNGYQLIISMTGFLKQLGIVCDNYSEIQSSIKYLKENSDLSPSIINDIANDYIRKGKDIIVRGLERQKDCANLLYVKDYMIIKGNSHSLGTGEEVKKIVNAQDIALRQLGLDSKRQLFTVGYTEYNKIVNLELLKSGIRGYYTVYKVVLSDRYERKVLSNSHQLKYKSAIQKSISNSTKSTAKSKQDVAIYEQSKLDFGTNSSLKNYDYTKVDTDSYCNKIIPIIKPKKQSVTSSQSLGIISNMEDDIPLFDFENANAKVFPK